MRSTVSVKIKPTQRASERFAYFALCEDTNRLPRIPLDPSGHSALECFHARETFGRDLPCREPDLLSCALNGKERHGVTAQMLAEDYIDRLITAKELRENYPGWVAREVFAQARKIAVARVGYMPTFVKTGEDFSTLPPSLR